MGMQSLAQLSPMKILETAVDKLNSISAKMGVRPMLFCIAVLVWLAILGLAGMQLIKLFTAVGAAGIGFYAGCVGFAFLRGKVSALAMFPDLLGYVLGIILVFVMFYLAWRMCVPFMYLLFGATGYFLASLFIGNWIVCLGIGVGMMLLTYFCFVFAVIGMTSIGAGIGAALTLGVMLPNVAALQLASGKTVLLIGMGIGAAFLLFQCVTTPNYRKIGI